MRRPDLAAWDHIAAAVADCLEHLEREAPAFLDDLEQRCHQRTGRSSLAESVGHTTRLLHAELTTRGVAYPKALLPFAVLLFGANAKDAVQHRADERLHRFEVLARCSPADPRLIARVIGIDWSRFGDSGTLTAAACLPVAVHALGVLDDPQVRLAANATGAVHFATVAAAVSALHGRGREASTQLVLEALHARAETLSLSSDVVIGAELDPVWRQAEQDLASLHAVAAGLDSPVPPRAASAIHSAWSRAAGRSGGTSDSGDNVDTLLGYARLVRIVADLAPDPDRAEQARGVSNALHPELRFGKRETMRRHADRDEHFVRLDERRVDSWERSEPDAEPDTAERDRQRILRWALPRLLHHVGEDRTAAGALLTRWIAEEPLDSSDVLALVLALHRLRAALDVPSAVLEPDERTVRDLVRRLTDRLVARPSTHHVLPPDAHPLAVLAQLLPPLWKNRRDVADDVGPLLPAAARVADTSRAVVARALCCAPGQSIAMATGLDIQVDRGWGEPGPVEDLSTLTAGLTIKPDTAGKVLRNSDYRRANGLGHLIALVPRTGSRPKG